MAIEVITRVLETSSAKHSARLVLLALAWHAREETGECWPSIETLMQETQLQETTVHDALRQLVAIGELAIATGKGPHGTNLYRLAAAVPMSGQLALSESRRGAESAPSQESAPEPSLPVLDLEEVKTGTDGLGAEPAPPAKLAPVAEAPMRITTVGQRERIAANAAALWVTLRRQHGIARFTDGHALRELRSRVVQALDGRTIWTDVDKAIRAHAGDSRASVYYIDEWIHEERAEREGKEWQARKDRERQESIDFKNRQGDEWREKLRRTYPGKSIPDALELERERLSSSSNYGRASASR